MTLKQAHVGQRLLFSIKRFFLETLSLSCTGVASLPMAAVSAVHLTVAHAGQARAVFIYAGITVAELGRLLGAALGVPPSCRTVGLRDSTTGSVVALALVASAPQALAPRRAYELVLEASGFAGGRLMEDAFAAFVDEMVARDLIDDEGADRVIALSEARDPLVRAAMELFLPSASASTSSSQGAQAAIDQLAASIVELAATTWSQLEARRSMLKHCIRLRSRAVLSRSELAAAQWAIVIGDGRLFSAFETFGEGGSEKRLVSDLADVAAALRQRGGAAAEELNHMTALLLRLVDIGLLERDQAIAARELVCKHDPAVLAAFSDFKDRGPRSDGRILAATLLRSVSAVEEPLRRAALDLDPLVDVVAELVSEGSLTASEGAWLRGRRVAGHAVLSGAVELYAEEGDVIDLQDTILRESIFVVVVVP